MWQIYRTFSRNHTNQNLLGGNALLKNQFKPQARLADLVVQELGGEILIYDLRTNQAFCLNETSALVWQDCDGSKTVAGIAEDLSQKTRSKVGEDFIWLALDGLKKNNLIENETDFAHDFAGLSRREAIRKIGLASLVALPLVASLTAPTAVQAQSVVCSGQNCRCNNTAASCNGTAGMFAGVSYVNCRTASGGNSNCNCQGPFGADNSAGTGFKAGKCSF